MLFFVGYILFKKLLLTENRLIFWPRNPYMQIITYEFMYHQFTIYYDYGQDFNAVCIFFSTQTVRSIHNLIDSAHTLKVKTFILHIFFRFSKHFRVILLTYKIVFIYNTSFSVNLGNSKNYY